MVQSYIIPSTQITPKDARIIAFLFPKVTPLPYSILLALRNISSTGLGLKWCLVVPTGIVHPYLIRPSLTLIASLRRSRTRLVIEVRKGWLRREEIWVVGVMFVHYM